MFKKQCINAGRVIFMTALASSVINANAAPVSGQVTSGSASISQNGLTTNISQTSDKVSINWQGFSIGQNEVVNFSQPEISSIALNRVIGNERSIIDGALNANGQVWLLNSNGILFGKNASINTASFLATTAALKDEDFFADKYSFEGASSSSIINQGTISVENGGYIVLSSNEVLNDGLVNVVKGRVHLVGADSYSLDLNGNSLLNLTVNKGVLDALAKNSGVIIADGGEVYLTSNAVNDLLGGVVNNTGIIEAKTIDDITGTIELFAHGGEVQIGGTLDASAPVSGNGGFIETSGKDFKMLDGFAISTTAANGQTGTWLIDPTDIYIEDGGADAITGSNIDASTIETALLSSNVNLTADEDIYIKEELNINQNILTLSAGERLFPMAPVNVNNSAGLKVEVAQSNSLADIYALGDDEATPGNYIYNDEDNEVIAAPLTIAPDATYLYKFASDGSDTALTAVINSGKFRVGNGWYNSVAQNGMLEQPWYYDNVTSGRDGWYKLTYSTYHLDQAIGIGGDGASAWNINGEIVHTDNEDSVYPSLNSLITNIDNDASGFDNSTGVGVITSTVTYNHPNYGEFDLVNVYQIDTNDVFIKTETTLQNNSGSNVENVRIWVGTRDDYIAQEDSNYKTKGNITADGFEVIENQTDMAKAIIITEDTFESGEGAAVLFYSTSSNTNTIIEDCCDFSNVIDLDPVTSTISLADGEDGSYGIFLSMGNIADTESKSLTWYYAAAPVAELENIVQDVVDDVAESLSPAPPSPAPPSPAPPSPTTNPSVESIIASIQNTTTSIGLPKENLSLAPTENTGLVLALQEGQVPDKLITLSEVRQSALYQSAGSSSPEVDIRVPLYLNSLITLINGGLNLPAGVEQEFFVVSK